MDACPQNLIQNNQKKFLSVQGNTCFLFVTSHRVIYDDAVAQCRTDNGTLAMPKTKDLNTFLLQEMRNLSLTEDMWIGMNQRQGGKMLWEDGTEVEDWGNFVDSAQDIRFLGGIINFGNGKHCVALNPKDGLWHDHRCLRRFLIRDAKLPYICQYVTETD